MQLKLEHTYHIRALVAEVAAVEAQLNAKRSELQSLLQELGLDPQRQAFVLMPGGKYPVGTVLDARTGEPYTVTQDRSTSEDESR